MTNRSVYTHSGIILKEKRPNPKRIANTSSHIFECLIEKSALNHTSEIAIYHTLVSMGISIVATISKTVIFVKMLFSKVFSF